jgi:hypothetical protein
MKLTEKQVAILRESIDSAQGYRECAYVAGEKPWCVVGQAAFRAGISVKKMRFWPAHRVDTYSNGVSIGGVMEEFFPIDLLAELQWCWDGQDGEENSTEEDAREEMHKILDHWIAEEFLREQEEQPVAAG